MHTVPRVKMEELEVAVRVGSSMRACVFAKFPAGGSAVFEIQARGDGAFKVCWTT